MLKRCRWPWLVLAGVVALPGLPLIARQPAAEQEDDKAAAGAPFDRLVTEAFPASAERPSRKHHGMSGLPRIRFPERSRVGWVTGWPRIPDLPQVKAKIPQTNRIVSRAEQERRDAAERAAPQQPRASDPQPAAGRTDDVRRALAEDAARREAFNRRAQRDQAAHDRRQDEAVDPRAGAPAFPSSGTRTGPIDGRLIGSEPLPSVRRSADDLVRSGDYESAARFYARHLVENAPDADAARALAVALLLANKPNQAADAMVAAYRIDPSIADAPFDAAVLPPDVSVRSLLQRAASHAQRSRTAGAWLVPAVLAQTQGKRDVAARFVERARVASLEPAIADALVAALSQEAPDEQAGGS